MPITKTINYDCGALLDRMRPEIETLLLELGFDQPPSQSLRAKRALEKVIEEMTHVRCLGTNWTTMRRKQEKLQDFLAVHHTVTLCAITLYEKETP